MNGPQVRLHGYFRSSASYRVRIALNLKGIAYDSITHHLRRGDQRSADYLRLNPQGLVPCLEHGSSALTQSLAIIEFLDECFPEPPLMPSDALGRARVRAFAQAIACDIHPVQNLKVLQRLRGLGLDETAVTTWARELVDEGLAACEELIGGNGGDYCFGNQITLADLCLIPQLSNARRFGMEPRWPKLMAVEAACLKIAAFDLARPENQSDAE